MLLPYTAGRLVARVHDDGEVLSTEHTADGTRLHARVRARRWPPSSRPPRSAEASTDRTAPPLRSRSPSVKPEARSADLHAMARLPMLALVLAGLVAGVALLWRARREAAGSRLPWLVLGVAGLIDASWVLRRGIQASADAGVIPSRRWSSLTRWLHLLSVPFVVLALLRGSRTRPPTAAGTPRRSSTRAWPPSASRSSTGRSSCRQRSRPTCRRQASLAVVQATCAVVVSTVCIHVLTRARQPGGLPFCRLGPVALGVLAHVVGLALLQMVIVAGGYRGSAVPGVRAGHRRSGGGGVRARTGPAPSRPSWPAAGRRAPPSRRCCPWSSPGCSSSFKVIDHRPVGDIVLVLCVALLVALLVGAVLTRIESLEVVRTLEDRVVERTLDLGTREKWFRALVSNASDVVTVLDRDGVIRYQTPSARRVLGHDPDRLVGLPFTRLLPSTQDDPLSSRHRRRRAARPTARSPSS